MAKVVLLFLELRNWDDGVTFPCDWNLAGWEDLPSLVTKTERVGRTSLVTRTFEAENAFRSRALRLP